MNLFSDEISPKFMLCGEKRLKYVCNGFVANNVYFWLEVVGKDKESNVFYDHE
jgi:hypothetical protein